MDGRIMTGIMLTVITAIAAIMVALANGESTDRADSEIHVSAVKA